jgi:TolA-binding protein
VLLLALLVPFHRRLDLRAKLRLHVGVCLLFGWIGLVGALQMRRVGDVAGPLGSRRIQSVEKLRKSIRWVNWRDFHASSVAKLSRQQRHQVEQLRQEYRWLGNLRLRDTEWLRRHSECYWRGCCAFLLGHHREAADAWYGFQWAPPPGATTLSNQLRRECLSTMARAEGTDVASALAASYWDADRLALLFTSAFAREGKWDKVAEWARRGSGPRCTLWAAHARRHFALKGIDPVKRRIGLEQAARAYEAAHDEAPKSESGANLRAEAGYWQGECWRLLSTESGRARHSQTRSVGDEGSSVSLRCLVHAAAALEAAAAGSGPSADKARDAREQANAVLIRRLGAAVAQRELVSVWTVEKHLTASDAGNDCQRGVRVCGDALGCLKGDDPLVDDVWLMMGECYRRKAEGLLWALPSPLGWTTASEDRGIAAAPGAPPDAHRLLRKAERAYKVVATGFPRSDSAGPARGWEGRIAWLRGDVQEAARHWVSALRCPLPVDEKASIVRSLGFWVWQAVQKDPDAALVRFRVPGADPTDQRRLDGSVRFAKGMWHYLHYDFAEAEREWAQVDLRLYDDAWLDGMGGNWCYGGLDMTTFYLGMAYYQQRKWPLAEQTFRQCLAEPRGYYLSSYRLCRVVEKTRGPEAGIKAFVAPPPGAAPGKATTYDSESTPLWCQYARGRLLYLLDAKLNYGHTRKLLPVLDRGGFREEGHQALIAHAIRERRFGDAVRWMERCLTEDPYGEFATKVFERLWTFESKAIPAWECSRRGPLKTTGSSRWARRLGRKLLPLAGLALKRPATSLRARLNATVFEARTEPGRFARLRRLQRVVDRLHWHVHCLLVYDEPMTRDAALYDYARFLYLNSLSLYNRAWRDWRGWFVHLNHEPYLPLQGERFPFGRSWAMDVEVKEPPQETALYRRYRWRTSSAAIAGDVFSEVARTYPQSRLAPWSLFMAGKAYEEAQLASGYGGLGGRSEDRGQEAARRTLVEEHPSHRLAAATRKRLHPPPPDPWVAKWERERAQEENRAWRHDRMPQLREALGRGAGAMLYERGLRAFYEYRIDDAAAEFGKLRHRFPHSRFVDDATFLLGLCHRERGEPARMRELFREHLRSHPDTFAAQGMRAFLR